MVVIYLYVVLIFQKGPHEPATYIQQCISDNFYTQKLDPCALLCGMTYRFYILLFKVDFYSDHFLVFTLEENQYVCP